MMRKQGLTLVEAIIVVMVIGIAAAILFPILARTRSEPPSTPQRRCLSHLKQLGLGIIQYTQDYNDKFPLLSVSVGGKPCYGWAHGIYPYCKSLPVLQCPAQNIYPTATPSGTSISPLDPQFTDYWMNARLDGANSEKLQFPEQTFLMGDGNDGTQRCDSCYALSDLPANWRTDSNSPASRHNGSASYLFADGHIKVLTPEKVTADPAAEPTFSFLPGPYWRSY